MIRRSVVVAVVLALPHVARAGRHCHEVSRVLGHSRCSGFGGWSRGASLEWDFGTTALRFSPHLDATAVTKTGDAATTYHFVNVPGDDRPVTAVGGMFRQVAGFVHGWYIVQQLELASVTGGPQLVTEVSARGTTTTTASASSGAMMQGTVGLGVRANPGFATIAGELAPGFRVGFFSTSLPTIAPPAQFWFVVQARAKVDFWLAPNLTLGVLATSDVTRTRDFSAGISFGLHLMPYDGQR